MDDDEFIDDSELKVSPERKQECPEYCSMFNCVVLSKTGNCKEECKRLEPNKSLICEICTENCSEERKRILLDANYLEHVESLKTDNTKENIEKVKLEYLMLEGKLQEVRDEFHKTPSYKFWLTGGLKEKSGKIRFEMTVYHKMMDKLGIEYEEIP